MPIAFLSGAITSMDPRERDLDQDDGDLEDREVPVDAIIRRVIVHRIDEAVRNVLNDPSIERVVVATTGGMPEVKALVKEVVRLHAPCGVDLPEPLEVDDGARKDPRRADKAVSRLKADPIESFRARRHALKLIEKGNLLGAWGAVQHLHEDEGERHWTRVLEWLACFASSMPVPETCEIAVLTHPRMAVRAALRAELALRAGDIPRAVHGTVAFFESALWDHLGPHLTRNNDPKKHRLFSVDPAPTEQLVRRGDGSSDDRRRPFEVAEEMDGARRYKVFDDDVCAIKLAKYYLKQGCILKLGQAVSGVRELRNDVAHNEPTPETMNGARDKMVEAQLWSDKGPQFLVQPLVQCVLRELGEQNPDLLCSDLISSVRARLLEVFGP